MTLGNGSFNGVVAGNIADSGALTFNNPAAQAYTGLLSGTGALNVSGPALLTLTGSNTGFTGLTTITSAGSLQIGNGVANAWLGATAIADSGTLIWSNTGSQTLSAPITGSGNLTKLGSGTLVLSASNGLSGTATIGAGVVQLSNLNALSGSTVVEQSGREQRPDLRQQRRV